MTQLHVLAKEKADKRVATGTSSPIVSFQIEGIYDINLHAGTRTKIQNNEIWCYARVIKGATQDTSKQTLIQEPSDTSNNNAYIITFGEANKEVSILTPQQLIDVRQDPNSTAGPQHVTFHCGRPSADDKNAASSQAQDASKPKGQASNKVQGSTGRVQLVSSNSISDSTAGITPSSTTSTPSGTTAGTSDGTFQGQPVVKSRRLRRRSLNKRESL